MPPKIEQATIIILDVGRNVSQSDEKGQKSFFSNARECAVRIIERKVLSQGNNLLGIILLGSKETKNEMAEQCDGAFRHISVWTNLETPSWQMIRNLPEMPTKYKGDWIDSLVVAADHMKNGVSGVKLCVKKIILMTNFKCPTCFEENDIEQVMNGFKEDNIELDIIGPDITDNNLKELQDLELARKFVDITDGATATFEDAMSYLLYHKKKAVNMKPWNVDLSIGPNVKIPVSVYIRLKDETVVNKFTKAIKNPVNLGPSTTEAVVTNKVHINTENQTIVQSDAIIKGYHYGQQIIPFAECDKSLLYNSGDKSLLVYGFTEYSNIHWQNFTGDGLYYVFGRKDDKKANHAIRCLVECLQEMCLVAVARRVYNKGNAAKMFVLMPVIDNNNYICLSMAELCYKEEIKHMSFPPIHLKRYEHTDKQVDAFKDLIRAMDLTKAYDENFDDAEAFPIAETVSPSIQYILDCIAYRAINPEKPLPKPRDDIMMLFKTPPLIHKKSKEPLEKLKSLFTLTKIEKKTKSKKSTNDILNSDGNQNRDWKPDDKTDMPVVQLPAAKTVGVTRIGTTDPANDFKLLIGDGKTLSELFSQMIDAIESLVLCNLDGTYSKALAAMKTFREECVKTDPNLYNNWLKEFKKTIVKQKLDKVSCLIKDNQLDFVLKEESPLSLICDIKDPENEIYEADTVPTAAELTMDTEINNLFDDM